MLRFTVPEELGDTATVLGDIRERIAAVEAEQTLMREDTGRNVLGRRAVLRQSWSGSPTTFEPRRNLRPRVAARSKWSRIAALLRNHAFVKAYQRARAAMLMGISVPFPPGTYWLRRFVGVPVEALQS